MIKGTFKFLVCNILQINEFLKSVLRTDPTEEFLSLYSCIFNFSDEILNLAMLWVESPSSLIIFV